MYSIRGIDRLQQIPPSNAATRRAIDSFVSKSLLLTKSLSNSQPIADENDLRVSDSETVSRVEILNLKLSKRPVSQTLASSWKFHDDETRFAN